MRLETEYKLRIFDFLYWFFFMIVVRLRLLRTMKLKWLYRSKTDGSPLILTSDHNHSLLFGISFSSCLFRNLAISSLIVSCFNTIWCHNNLRPCYIQVILMAGSQYFHAMFLCDMTEHDKDAVVIKGISKETFSSLLNFLYSGRLV